jgi:hypothetical protein
MEPGIQWLTTDCSRNQPSSKKKIEQQKKANTNTKVVCIMTWADDTR